MEEQRTDNSKESNWRRIWRDFWITIVFMVASDFLGFIFIWMQSTGNKITATLWALSCLASGGIVGFLFGIPRVLQDNNVPNAIVKENGETDEPAKASQPFYRMQVNTNLEQISDWLTKIIVGIGLIEMRQLPDRLNSLSAFLAAGLGDGSPQAQSLAAAIIVYFVVQGFLGGYLITRIYLAQAFSRADWGTQNTVIVGGQKLTLEEVSEQQRLQLADLQEQVIKVQTEGVGSQSNETVEEKIASGEITKVRSILWVDDHPKNNSLHVERLNKLGIEIALALSTAEALKQLEFRTFDRIISDMGRTERNLYNESAGIDLVKAIKERGINTPIVIFCGKRGVANHRQKAIEAGAIEVTSSSTVLMKALQIET